ncbi:unnamed protein product [Pleuronectes platessa]|uniref:Uncharacterized protein n=1 Tax=Pleuronectes platessa TaxID=8262 RepID=A0A9N7U0V1_PLEPL|nr:unnamed protein product [Pleuronectes platessa]
MLGPRWLHYSYVLSSVQSLSLHVLAEPRESGEVSETKCSGRACTTRIGRTLTFTVLQMARTAQRVPRLLSAALHGTTTSVRRERDGGEATPLSPPPRTAALPVESKVQGPRLLAQGFRAANVQRAREAERVYQTGPIEHNLS